MQSAHSGSDIQISGFERDRHWLFVKRIAKSHWNLLGEDGPGCSQVKKWSESDAVTKGYINFRVLEVGGVPKGFAISTLPYPSSSENCYIATVLQLAVSESRQGYGGELLADAEARIREKDLTCPIMLGLAPGNEKALAFFKKYGFMVDTREPSGLQLYKY